MIAIAIDDEPIALDIVKSHASKVLTVDLVEVFTNAFDAVHYLQQHPVDLIFLDIKMPDISGVDVVKCLPRNPMVIFTTAYSDYAVQGFELDAIDYLLKPFSLARFLKACTKALDSQSARTDEEPFIFIKTGYEEEKVRVDDILYLEADGNYLSFVLPTRRLLSRQTLVDALQLLPPGLFVRVHRSYAIAVRKIDRIARQEIRIAEHTIPIGASYEHTLTDIRSALNLR